MQARSSMVQATVAARARHSIFVVIALAFVTRVHGAPAQLPEGTPSVKAPRSSLAETAAGHLMSRLKTIVSKNSHDDDGDDVHDDIPIPTVLALVFGIPAAALIIFLLYTRLNRAYKAWKNAPKKPKKPKKSKEETQGGAGWAMEEPVLPQTPRDIQRMEGGWASGDLTRHSREMSREISVMSFRGEPK